MSGAGDVDGDGIDDLIIGASGADPNGRDDAGASYVVFGSDQGFPATIDLATRRRPDHPGRRGVTFRHSVSGAGDVNGDGIDDLIIGAFCRPERPYMPAPAMWCSAAIRAFRRPSTSRATPTLIIQGAAPGDYSGCSVSGAGDVNGDGIDDLIIGASRPTRTAVRCRRQLCGVRHAIRAFRATIDLASDADLIIQGAAAYDHSGRSVSGAGDVDGDGIDDLIIGAYRADPNGRNDAGASYVVFGSGPAAAIEDLIAEVEAADLQPRIEKILTKTLSRALDNLNKGKESRAIIALRVFIIEVKALRGKKIDEADADEWIADARAIIDTLKAQRDRHREPRHHAPSPMVEAQE